MATAVASSITSPSSTSGKLQAGKVAEAKRRAAKPQDRGFMQGLVSKNAYRLMAGAAATTAVPDYSYLSQPSPSTYSIQADDEEDEQEDSAQARSRFERTASGLTAGEDYQQAARKRRLQYQIGQELNLDRAPKLESSESGPDIREVAETTNARLAEQLLQNQLGNDLRNSSAKLASLNATKDAGIEQIVQKLEDEAAGLASNLIGDAAEVLDIGEDGFIAQGLVLIQRFIQLVRTIFTSAPAPVNEAEDIQAMLENIESRIKESFMNALFPRFGIDSIKGLSGSLGVLYYGFVVGMGLALTLGVMAAVVGTIYYYFDSPVWSVLDYIHAYLPSSVTPYLTSFLE